MLEQTIWLSKVSIFTYRTVVTVHSHCSAFASGHNEDDSSRDGMQGSTGSIESLLYPLPRKCHFSLCAYTVCVCIYIMLMEWMCVLKVILINYFVQCYHSQIALYVLGPAGHCVYVCWLHYPSIHIDRSAELLCRPLLCLLHPWATVGIKRVEWKVFSYVSILAGTDHPGLVNI